MAGLIGLVELDSGMVAIDELYGRNPDVDMDEFGGIDAIPACSFPGCAWFTCRRFEIICIERQVAVSIFSGPGGSPGDNGFPGFFGFVFVGSVFGDGRGRFM